MCHDLYDGKLCKKCFGEGDTLTTDCCGRILLPQERWEIARGNFDFIANRGWIEQLLDAEEQAS